MRDDIAASVAQPRVLAADAEAIAAAVAALQSGKLIAFPTDTVYALACAWDNAEALARLYEAKQRDPAKAIPILIADPALVSRFGDTGDPRLARMLRAFWPGPLTVVLPARHHLPEAVRAEDAAGRPTVALRMPDHPLALSLIRQAGGAVAATSANRSGAAPALSTAAVLATLGDTVAVALDSDQPLSGVASTIIRMADGDFQMLRTGAISREAITAAIE